MGQLVLKRASASRLSGEWSDDDYDVVADGAVVGRIMKAAAAPVDAPWLWTLAYGHAAGIGPPAIGEGAAITSKSKNP